MPIFGESSSPYDEYVEKVTAETATSENWEWFMNICDRVNMEGPKGCKACLLSVKKRLNHRDPHVVLYALSLLDCLWNNCGQKFRREVSSKEFINELSYKCTNSNRAVAEAARLLIKKWAQNECKQDNSLSLVESLYKDLLEQGYSFEEDPASGKKKTMFKNTDPNVVSTDQEEADIAKAIALSLQESGGKKQQQQQYPALGGNQDQQQQQRSQSYSTVIGQQKSQQQMQKMARALYDFEAAEDNEISFTAGDLINVLDDSDANWWRGQCASGGPTGLFPASFVTTDLAELPAHQSHQMDEEKATEVEAATSNALKVQIDENVLLKCIELIEGLDPSLDASTDPPELALMENLAMAQAPLIDQKLMQMDKQLNLLADVDLAIRDVLGAYDSAVQQVAGGAVSSSGTTPSLPVATAVQATPTSSSAAATMMSSAASSTTSVPAAGYMENHHNTHQQQPQMTTPVGMGGGGGGEGWPQQQQQP